MTEDPIELAARIIDPASWMVLDSYLADTKRKYAGQDAAYDPAAFKDRRSMEKARLILTLLSEPTHPQLRAMAESQARDDEGQFPSLGDMIDCSGENKTHTILREAYRAAMGALK